MELPTHVGVINEQLITQLNHSPQDSVGLGPNCIQFTVKNLPDSDANLLIGIGQNASDKNLLQPGESATYENIHCYLTDSEGNGNALYLAFQPNNPITTGGRALVSAINVDRNSKKC